ncbi:DUF1934 domain-containing protein [Bacillus sp. MRMR6]|uniref:DUF1934 domain-containing protein n=1 Tax=Bacillus sp. MRMR6 TaxID=1928617 RepID=UPI000951A7AC|nr:DUF1934 domain-containing protein [Bacillus sp. MRMR6]OLS41243.1 hypothetical protein BTR25_05110 [Bacillus sp. MRMR6]
MSTPETETIVKVNVKTTIDQNETFELTVFGRYFEKGNAHFLKYEEVIEEGTVRTIVKISKTGALILRGGALKMRLPFEVNRRLNGSYEMSFGEFATETTARKIDFSYENGKGLIEIVYDFSLNGSPDNTYHLEIAFQEEK